VADLQPVPPQQLNPRQQIVRILLVEDDEDDSILTQACIDEMPGLVCQVDWVSTMNQATERLAHGAYDIALLDFHLGAHTGIDVLRAVEGCPTPCILLTGRNDFSTDLEGMAAGAYDYLIKSELTGVTLGRTVRYALGHASQLRKLETAQQRLHHEARHDPLTGLANRTVVIDRCAALLAERGTSVGSAALLFLDLDDFKAVNDTRGHLAGDSILTAVSKRLLSVTTSDMLVTRLGGDEFSVLVNNATPEEINQLARRLIESMNQPFQLDDVIIRIGASIGVAYDGPNTTSATDLMRDADVALYEAKRAGRNRYRTFVEPMGQSVVERVTLEQGLRSAIANNEISTVFQPLFDPEQLRFRGFEALVRWNHAVLGPIAPNTFIAVAESIGVINEIGLFVLDQSIAALTRWRGMYDDSADWVMSVNLSAKQLEDPRIVQRISEVLHRYNCPPSRLQLELTESVMVRRTDRVLERLAALVELGVGLAMDDFGTGFSSFSYLHDLPLHTIKIDRSFVARITEPRGAAVVRAIVAMAKSLGLRTVAEGIETIEQLEAVRVTGCELAQGRIISMPLGVAELERDVLIGDVDQIEARLRNLGLVS
jgi:diguanylate cyclase